MEDNAMALKAISISTIQSTVYKQLVSAIMQGEIKPGEKITMEGLAKQLNVSIMPVREAIRRLEANKIVTIQNIRIAVNQLSVEDLNQILEVRLVLECYAAEKAALHRRTEILDSLENLLKIMETTTDSDEYLKANNQFHAIIYKEAKVPVMVEIIDSLWERYSAYFFIMAASENKWAKPEFFKNHRRIFDGIRRRDPVEVRKWLEKDLKSGFKVLLERFS